MNRTGSTMDRTGSTMDRTGSTMDRTGSIASAFIYVCVFLDFHFWSQGLKISLSSHGVPVEDHLRGRELGPSRRM